MGGHAGRLVKGVTVELEVCDGRERGAAGEDRALVVSLRREDVGAQVAPVVLGRETGGKVGANVIHSAVTVALVHRPRKQEFSRSCLKINSTWSVLKAGKNQKPNTQRHIP